MGGGGRGRVLHLDNLVGIIDVNGLGQSRPTQFGHDLGSLERRWRAFGWHTVAIDGHDMDQILAALAEARATTVSADDDRGPHRKRGRASASWPGNRTGTARR